MSVFVPKSHLEGLEWPAMAEGRTRTLMALLFRLEQSQWWTPQDIKAKQLHQLGHLVTHASDTIPYYNKRLKEAGLDFKGKITEKQWESIPLLRREDI